MFNDNYLHGPIWWTSTSQEVTGEDPTAHLRCIYQASRGGAILNKLSRVQYVRSQGR
jgi:hypothetical protein